MASVGGVTVTLRAKDEITPALRRIRREMWLTAHATAVYVALLAALFTLGILIGRFVL